MVGARSDVFREFCRETTAHAFDQIGDPERRKWVRALWIIVLLAFTAVFIWQSQLLVKKYLQYETTTITTVSAAPFLPFPMVTLCNVNPFQRDRIPKGSDMSNYISMVDTARTMNSKAEVKEMCQSHSDTAAQLFCSALMNGTNNGTEPSSTIGPEQDNATTTGGPPRGGKVQILGDRFSILDMENKASKEIGTLFASGKGRYTDAGQSVDDFIQECEYKSSACGSSRREPHPWYGVCHRINHNGAFVSCRPGPSHGLALELHVNLSQYLPSTFSVGVRVGIDQAGRMASFPETDGVFVPVGTATAIGMTLVETNRLGAPYGNCVDDATMSSTVTKYYYPGNYTMGGCVASCLQHQIVQACDCWYFAYSPPPGEKEGRVPLCVNATAIKCAAEQELRKHNNDACSCYPLCDARAYQLTISHSYWPNPAVARCPPSAVDCKDPSKYASSNLLKLQIYYDTMTKYTYTETASYTALSLVSDFGGQLGLWIGASFCTVLELIFFSISIITTCFGCTDHSVEKDPQRRDRRNSGPTLGQVNPLRLYPTAIKVDPSYRPQPHYHY